MVAPSDSLVVGQAAGTLRLEVEERAREGLAIVEGITEGDEGEDENGEQREAAPERRRVCAQHLRRPHFFFFSRFMRPYISRALHVRRGVGGGMGRQVSGHHLGP